MVTSTRRTTMKNDALEYVLLTLMGLNTKSHTYYVIHEEGIPDVAGISGLTELEILRLNANVIDDQGDIVERSKSIPTGHQSSLRLIGELLRFLREEKGSALSDYEVMKITKEHFDAYRMSIPITLEKSNTRSSSNVTNTTVTNSDVKDFIKGNKRDKTQYNLLKDEHQFGTWY
jgi:hypothetical protein